MSKFVVDGDPTMALAYKVITEIGKRFQSCEWTNEYIRTQLVMAYRLLKGKEKTAVDKAGEEAAKTLLTGHTDDLRCEVSALKGKDFVQAKFYTGIDNENYAVYVFGDGTARIKVIPVEED